MKRDQSSSGYRALFVTATLLVLAAAVTLAGAGMPSQTLFAQGALGTIAGNLLDQNGSVVTGLDTPIYVTNAETGVEYSVAVTLDGAYTVTGLPAGAYGLSFPISCCMYESYTQENVVITAGETLRLDLNLQRPVPC